ncbi:flavin-containing monooxygenase [Hydrocarboniphaga effusa]|uniref:flavin-containing monooxygenase n=1 Tax=Hydrocarboniphaga effusa TaxID=243629 RepID=UPI0035AF5C0D
MSQHGSPLAAIIIGAGFAGIGMGIALRRERIDDFVILEKAQDVGGVWRDNRYPGAACDVPSHLYSYSFEPNPDWTHVFSRQPEIADYLRHCANKYDLLRHLRFGAEVHSARYDETGNLWTVLLRDGSELRSKLLISGVGQLSRPATPRIAGIESFEGHSFHSASWDESYSLAGKRVAVIGTGASAIQFVPAIAPQVERLSVFQRSPAWMMRRADRAYSAFEKRLMHAVPALSRLYRLGIYLRYEARALAFTRFKSLMKIAVEWPFRRMLARDVPDAALRAKLTPDYPVGCKRILLSDDYLTTMSRENVELVTESIRRIVPTGVETQDGRVHEVDAIVYGTGFSATEFLAPMSIRGRRGLDLNEAWLGGAMAYLGMTVPGFPNFFMLYGPNTNLGHNSIVYMLESQIRHVMRCIRRMRMQRANAVEVQAERHSRYNLRIQQRLGATVWNGCKSWYVDANGHNSTNWPGFTLSYRFMTRFSSLRAYRFAAALPSTDSLTALKIPAPLAPFERASAALMRGILRTTFRAFIGPPFPVGVERAVVAVIVTLMPKRFGTRDKTIRVADRPVVITSARRAASAAAILYLHGGAFCLGNPRSHRSITSHLALASQLPVWTPDYRLAPEHPHPAAIDDAMACVHAMIAQGIEPERIVVAGDSAGGALALEVGLRMRDQGQAPGGLALISPFTDHRLAGDTIRTLAGVDPMIRIGWLRQGIAWYGAQGPTLLERDLAGLPPMLIHVGDQEILLSDSTRLAERAAAQGVQVQLEIHAARWHVFHLQALYLSSSVDALSAIGAFCRRCVPAKRAESSQASVAWVGGEAA